MATSPLSHIIDGAAQDLEAFAKAHGAKVRSKHERDHFGNMLLETEVDGIGLRLALDRGSYVFDLKSEDNWHSARNIFGFLRDEEPARVAGLTDPEPGDLFRHWDRIKDILGTKALSEYEGSVGRCVIEMLHNPETLEEVAETVSHTTAA